MQQQELLNRILDNALKVSTEKNRLLEVFKKSGIKVAENYLILETEAPEEETIEKLMANLTELPVVKISAKQVIRKAKLGI